MCRTKRKFKKMQFFISKINVQCLRIFFIVHLVDNFKQFFSKPYWELNCSKNDNQGLPGISLSFEIVAATHFYIWNFSITLALLADGDVSYLLLLSLVPCAMWWYVEIRKHLFLYLQVDMSGQRNEGQLF